MGPIGQAIALHHDFSKILMRRLLATSIIVLGMVWTDSVCAGMEMGASSPPVRLAPPGLQPSFETVELPSTYVLEIVGDRHGFVWIAGDRGVHRFDGRSYFNL